MLNPFDSTLFCLLWSDNLFCQVQIKFIKKLFVKYRCHCEPVKWDSGSRKPLHQGQERAGSLSLDTTQQVTDHCCTELPAEKGSIQQPYCVVRGRDTIEAASEFVGGTWSDVVVELIVDHVERRHSCEGWPLGGCQLEIVWLENLLQNVLVSEPLKLKPFFIFHS